MSMLNDLEALDDFSESMDLPAELALEVFMHHIGAEQPIGHEEVGYVGSVSARLKETPVSDGWRQEIEAIKRGVSAKVRNVSEHFRWVVGATKRHDIRGRPKVRFWWGDPHPWPAPDYSYTGLPMGPGWYSYGFVDHPGTAENPFVRKARSLAKPGMTEIVRRGIDIYIDRVITSTGLRRIR